MASAMLFVLGRNRRKKVRVLVTLALSSVWLLGLGCKESPLGPLRFCDSVTVHSGRFPGGVEMVGDSLFLLCWIDGYPRVTRPMPS